MTLADFFIDKGHSTFVVAYTLQLFTSAKRMFTVVAKRKESLAAQGLPLAARMSPLAMKASGRKHTPPEPEQSQGATPLTIPFACNRLAVRAKIPFKRALKHAEACTSKLYIKKSADFSKNPCNTLLNRVSLPTLRAWARFSCAHAPRKSSREVAGDAIRVISARRPNIGQRAKARPNVFRMKHSAACTARYLKEETIIWQIRRSVSSSRLMSTI